MSYGDFFIRFEHKFLRNIYPVKQLKQSNHLLTIENYYEIYQKFIRVCIGLLSVFNSYMKNIDDEDLVNSDLAEFVEDNYPDDTLDELKNGIMQTEIKNALKDSHCNIPKLNFKIYAFIYDMLVDFPSTDILYDTITTNKFFVNFHRMIKANIYLHHSHVTGEILGYTHDFCNLRVRGNKIELPVIAHNLFGFDLFYSIKGYVVSALCSKEIKIGGSNLTHINFSNITGEVKFIDTLKYYQKSLGELASTLSDEEKIAVKTLTEQFFNQNYYFSEIWPYLGNDKKIYTK